MTGHIVPHITAYGRSLLKAASAALARTALGLGDLAEQDTVNNSDWSGTALAIGNGGTGATTQAGAQTALGLGTSDSPTFAGVTLDTGGVTSAGNISGRRGVFEIAESYVINVNRTTDDGQVIRIQQDGNTEGAISVSGTTVSYNGAHLSRWSQWSGPVPSVKRGMVLTNLDEMCVWLAQEWDEVEGIEESVRATVVKRTKRHELYKGNVREVGTTKAGRRIVLEANEQLNRVAVSSVAFDPNVAGVFEQYDLDDDYGDFYVACRGDFVVRIAKGTTVQKGDILVSDGAGMAMPLDPDTPMTARLQSAVLGKVMSSHVVETDDDGSYLVPVYL